MKVLAVLAIVFLAGASARRPGGGFRPPRPTSPFRECVNALMPESERDQVKEIVEGCIEENNLEGLIEELEEQEENEVVLGEERRGRGRRRGPDELLEENGYTTEALALRTCVADGLGFVAEDGTFDGEAFIASLQEKVAGTELEANVQTGVDTCDSSGFTDFKIGDFIKCVVYTCAKGSTPSED